MPPASMSVPLGHAVTPAQNLTVSSGVTNLTVPAGAAAAFIQVTTNGIYLSEDGTTPSSSSGAVVLNAGDAWVSFEPSRVGLTRQSVDSNVKVNYYN